MPKIKRRVYQLAKAVGASPEEALAKLSAAGLRVSNIHDLVAEAVVERALRLLKGEEPPRSSRSAFAPPAASAIDRPPVVAYRALPSSRLDPGIALAPKKRKKKEPRTRDVSRLSEEDVLAIRKRMATTLIAEKDAFGASKPLWPDRLSMAVQRQFTSAGGIFKYKTVPELVQHLFCKSRRMEA